MPRKDIPTDTGQAFVVVIAVASLTGTGAGGSAGAGGLAGRNASPIAVNTQAIGAERAAVAGAVEAAG